MKKILHITASMDPKLGGVCQALKTIVSGLNTHQDSQNEIVSFDDPDASFINIKSYKIHALGAGKGPWFQNAAYISWLIQNLSNYDVVVLHGLWNYQGYGLVKAIKTLKRADASFTTKFFVMPHGMLDPYFQKAAGRKLKAIRNWIYWKLIERKVINQSDGLLFTCEAELLLARQTFSNYKPVKEFVVGLGVDEPPVFEQAMQDAFSAKCPNIKNQPYLLFISRIHEKKGVDLLVEAYNAIRKKSTDASFINEKSSISKLVIAGPGLETSYGQKILGLVSGSKDIKDQITFPEMLTGEAKWGAFYGSEVFILPSHQENFGIAVVEALACGKPVLISNQVNIWKEIESSNAGFIEEDTLEGTTNLLSKWTLLPTEDKLKISKNARMCYEKFFAVAPAAQHFFKAISD